MRNETIPTVESSLGFSLDNAGSGVDPTFAATCLTTNETLNGNHALCSAFREAVRVSLVSSANEVLGKGGYERVNASQIVIRSLIVRKIYTTTSTRSLSEAERRRERRRNSVDVSLQLNIESYEIKVEYRIRLPLAAGTESFSATNATGSDRSRTVSAQTMSNLITTAPTVLSDSFASSLQSEVATQLASYLPDSGINATSITAGLRVLPETVVAKASAESVLTLEVTVLTSKTTMIPPGALEDVDPPGTGTSEGDGDSDSEDSALVIVLICVASLIAVCLVALWFTKSPSRWQNNGRVDRREEREMEEIEQEGQHAVAGKAKGRIQLAETDIGDHGSREDVSKDPFVSAQPLPPNSNDPGPGTVPEATPTTPKAGIDPQVSASSVRFEMNDDVEQEGGATPALGDPSKVPRAASSPKLRREGLLAGLRRGASKLGPKSARPPPSP